MWPIFNENVAEKWNLWVREQCTVYTDWLKIFDKSNFVATVHAQCMNSSHNSKICPKTCEKKKEKKEKEKRKRGPKRNLSGLTVALLINAI